MRIIYPCTRVLNRQCEENPDGGNQPSHRTALIEGWGVLNDNKAISNSEWLFEPGNAATHTVQVRAADQCGAAHWTVNSAAIDVFAVR